MWEAVYPGRPGRARSPTGPRHPRTRNPLTRLRPGRFGIPRQERHQYVTVDTIQRWRPGTLPETLPHRVHWHDGRGWEISRFVSRRDYGSRETGTLVTRRNVLIGRSPQDPLARLRRLVHRPQAPHRPHALNPHLRVRQTSRPFTRGLTPHFEPSGVTALHNHNNLGSAGH